MTPYQYYQTYGRWPDASSTGVVGMTASPQTATSQYGFGGNFGLNEAATSNPYNLGGTYSAGTVPGAQNINYTAPAAGTEGAAGAGLSSGLRDYGVPIASIVGAGANLYGAIAGAQNSRRALAEQKRINQMYIDEFNLRKANREQTQQNYANIYG